MIPPIRYPLPTLIAVVLLGLAVWWGEALTRPLRSALAARWSRLVEGPPVPSSTQPQVVAGAIVRQALLLHDEVATSTRPGGPPSESIRVRMFVKIYDVWPLHGTPTHYRVGNRRPIGWVRAEELLPWDTRLVLRAPGGTLALAETPQGRYQPIGDITSSLPVVAWTGDAVQVAVWESGRPWQAIQGRGWVSRAAPGPEHWGVWLSRDELLALMRLSDPSREAPAPDVVRLRAVLGRLSDQQPMTVADRDAARRALPALVFDRAAAPDEEASLRLARINADWSPEASWGGFTFRFVPLTALP